MRNTQALQEVRRMKDPTWTTQKIESLEDLENLVFDLPDAEGRPIYVLKKPLIGDKKKIDPAEIGEVKLSDLVLDTTRKAVVNTRWDTTAQVASVNYQILSHKDYFTAVIDMCRQRGMINVQGYVIISNKGNRVKARVIFAGKTVDERGMPGNIRFGAEFANSYDSAYAATFKAFFLRMSCLNQLVTRNIIPEAVFSHPHSAANRIALLESVTMDLEHSMETLDAAGLTFKKYMDAAMDDEIIYESADQIKALMKEIFKVDTHAEAIAAIANRQARVHPKDKKYHVTTRWDLVNAATAYLSHAEDITPNVQDSIMYRTETKLLKTEIELPAVPAQ